MRKLKNYLFLIGVSATLWSCSEEALESPASCTYHAVVEDHADLDGCGFLFKLDNGEYLNAVWRWGFCGTPPLPEGATEDPLWDFAYEPGKRVSIDFELVTDYAGTCMKGKAVIITCLEEVKGEPRPKH